jgi:hypothetical protein
LDSAVLARISGFVGVGAADEAMLAGDFGATIGAELSPHGSRPMYFVGGSYRGVRGVNEDDGHDESRDTDVLSATFELHPAGRFWVDPFLSLDAGYAFFSFDTQRSEDHSKRESGAALGAGGGLVFHMKQGFSVTQHAIFMAEPTLDRWSLSVDWRLDVRF